MSIHELDIRLDANRGTLPRVGGSDSGSLICISCALVVKLFLGDDCFGGSRTPLIGFARQPIQNIDLRLFQNPHFFYVLWILILPSLLSLPPSPFSLTISLIVVSFLIDGFGPSSISLFLYKKPLATTVLP